MTATLVTAPARHPRVGGIKSVVGDFVAEQRLAIGDIVWEDSGCGLPKSTRAGCYDDIFPLVYDPVRVDSEGAIVTFTQDSEGTVTVDANLVDRTGTTGFNVPWKPTTAVSEVNGTGTINISTDGVLTYAGTPLEHTNFTYATTDRTGGVTPDKTFSGITQHAGIGNAFARYAGVSCYLGGDADGASYMQQAQDLLAAGEDREVERVLWDWALATSMSETAVDLTEAISLAEDAADSSYVGQPVLVMSRAAVTFAAEAGVVTRDGNAIHTINGTPVIATGVIPNTEELNVVAIGWPAVYVSEVVSTTTNDVQANRAAAIAERVYAIGVDCEFRYKSTASAMRGAQA